MTGGNAGIGFATAQQLARRGAHVVLACRDSGRAQQAAEVRRGWGAGLGSLCGSGPKRHEDAMVGTRLQGHRFTSVVPFQVRRYQHDNDPCCCRFPPQEIRRTPLLALPPSSTSTSPTSPSPALCSCESLPVPLDLSRLSSVRSFAACWAARGLPLHLLVCNAGVMGPPDRRASADGHELQFQVGC